MQLSAGIDGVVFHSHGHKLLGGFYRAAGKGPRPTAVLLHGIPGVEKNLDIAYALRDAGWNCLYFHFRGSWGSGGDYSLHGLVDDTRAATDWVLQRPEVDGGRLALVGMSLGGYTALAAGAADGRFRAVAALCPLLDPCEAPLSDADAAAFAEMLHGITAAAAQAQWAALPPIPSLAGSLRDRPVLLVTAEEDHLFPPTHYTGFAASLPSITWRRFPGADHAFSPCRRELVEVVMGWLAANA